MRTILPPEIIPRLDIVSRGNRTTSLAIWLALKSSGNVLDIGCATGERSSALALMLLRFKRSVIAIDWSQEHRIHPKQRRKFCPYEICQRGRNLDNVTVVDLDPSTVPVDNFQPIGFAIVDYDYALAGLKRVTEPVLAAAPVLATPNAIVAWAGYRTPRQYRNPDSTIGTEPNEVRNYVGSLDVGDTYHVEGSEVAFKVYNATPEFREELRSLSRV